MLINQSTSRLPSVFDNMSASYKAYWFIGLLECLNEEGLNEIPIRRICARMLVNAWYPVHFFKLHFGIQDLISLHNVRLKELLNVDADIKKDKLIVILSTSDNSEVKNLVMHFQKNVTFRFLSPWIKYDSDSQVERKSQAFFNNAPYSINRTKGTITINPDWETYLKENYAVLRDYGYWKLAQYIQTKNPGIPDIINKLIKPATRESLNKQRKFWDIVFEQHHTIQCIYSNTQLTQKAYAVEHYIPWSFTVHNQIWNLIPANQTINSSKSNKLPQSSFLKKFTDVQRLGMQAVYNKNVNYPLFEDYAVMGISISELLLLSDEKFHEVFHKQISPQIQLAQQLGFQNWDHII